MARELGLGGSERQMTEIARALDRTKFEPRVGCFLPGGDRGDQLRAAGVPVVQFPVHSYKSPTAIAGAFQLARYIRKERIDLVHTFDFPLNVFAIPITRLFTRAVPVSSQRSHRKLVPPGYARMLRLSDRLAKSVVVNCKYLERHLTHDESVPAERIAVCPNGIDLDVFSPSSRPREGPLVIGTVCGLHRWKGLITLLDAFAMVRKLQSGMRLVIVGSGSMLAELQSRAGELNIGDAVTFEPGTSDVTRWLRKFDIFVLPSLSEAFSNALMEAMACGCSAVASDVGGNPELIQPNETGLLFEAGNAESLASALRTLIEDPILRKRLADNGFGFVLKNYSIQSAASRMGDIYSKLLIQNLH